MKPGNVIKRFPIAALLAGFVVLSGCTGTGGDPLAKLPAKPATTAEQNAALLIRYCDKLRVDGDFVAAAAICRRALKYAPTDQVALMSLGRIFEAMGAPREAAAPYRRVLALNPTHAVARYSLGKAYLMLGQYDFAEQQLQIALNSGRGSARAYSLLGVIRDKMGRHMAAQEVYREGVLQHQGDIPLRTNLGLSLVLSGQYPEGLELLREVAGDPAAGSASRQGLAFAYAVTGDMAAAEAMAMIDLPPEAARTTIAHYESLRNAGVGAPLAPPSLVAVPVGGGVHRAAGKPVDLVLQPAAAIAMTRIDPGGTDLVSCRTGPDKPFCGGKY